MKQVIKRKMYNTETAEEIGFVSNGLDDVFDEEFCSETLYRKKKSGEFFLLGRGGCDSKYAVSKGYYICGGEFIFPFTEDEAKDWVELHMSADDYEALFGPVEE